MYVSQEDVMIHVMFAETSWNTPLNHKIFAILKKAKNQNKFLLFEKIEKKTQEPPEMDLAIDSEFVLHICLSDLNIF